MNTTVRRNSKWFATAALTALLPISLMAWEPNAKDLDKAIASADFSVYSANLTAWLNENSPTDPAKVSRESLEALLDKPDFALALAQRQFIGKLGSGNLASAAKDPANRDFLTWLLGSTEAMSNCLEGATPVRINERRDNSWGIHAPALVTWKKIYDLDPESREGVLLKLAIAVSMSPPGTGNQGAGQAATPEDPIDRYQQFKAAYKNGELARGFETNGVWEYRQFTSSNASDEDLAWARQMINTWRPDLRIDEMVVNSTSEVWYRNSPVPFNNSFKNVLAGGGKCGPRSSWAVFINQAFGIPVVGVRQPGHAAAALKAVDPASQPQAGNIWKVVYGRGWGASNPGYDFYVAASVRASLQEFMSVERMRWLASVLNSDAVSAAVTQVAHSITDARVAVITGTAALDTAVFARAADETLTLTEFAAPSEDGDYYTARVRGFLTPPESGDYVFSTASDDDSDLFLSTDESPDNKQHIVFVRGWTGLKEFSRRSAPVSLEAGKRYYIEAVHRELDGGDHFAAGWSGPGVTDGVIPGSALATYPAGKKGSIVREVWRDANNPPKAKELEKAVAMTKPEAPVEVAPGVVHIEAEDFDKDNAIRVLDCYTGGKQVNFGKSIDGAYVEYSVDAPKAGVYELTMRTSAVNYEQYFMVTASDKAAVTALVPNSAGLWATTEPVDVELAEGTQTLRVTAPNQRGVALRWLQLKAK